MRDAWQLREFAARGTIAISRVSTGMSAIVGRMNGGRSAVTAAVLPVEPMPETRMMEQQLPLSDPAISDVEHLLFGSEQPADAATSQQQTGCTTTPSMLHA